MREDDHFEEVAEIKCDDIEGYEIVRKLNTHGTLLKEIDNLRNVLLEINELIPIDKIQHDDPNKDELLHKISNIISDACYGS